MLFLQTMASDYMFNRVLEVSEEAIIKSYQLPP
jgi:hypothetical protein